MMATITYQSFRQAPDENKFFSNDYTQWLGVGETVVSVIAKIDNPTVPPLVVAPTVINTGLGVKYEVSGGVHGQKYRVGIEVTTNLGQIKEDLTIFSIIDPLVAPQVAG